MIKRWNIENTALLCSIQNVKLLWKSIIVLTDYILQILFVCVKLSEQFFGLFLGKPFRKVFFIVIQYWTLITSNSFIAVPALARARQARLYESWLSRQQFAGRHFPLGIYFGKWEKLPARKGNAVPILGPPDTEVLHDVEQSVWFSAKMGRL